MTRCGARVRGASPSSATTRVDVMTSRVVTSNRIVFIMTLLPWLMDALNIQAALC